MDALEGRWPVSALVTSLPQVSATPPQTPLTDTGGNTSGFVASSTDPSSLVPTDPTLTAQAQAGSSSDPSTTVAVASTAPSVDPHAPLADNLVMVADPSTPSTDPVTAPSAPGSAGAALPASGGSGASAAPAPAAPAAGSTPAAIPNPPVVAADNGIRPMTLAPPTANASASDPSTRSAPGGNTGSAMGSGASSGTGSGSGSSSTSGSDAPAHHLYAFGIGFTGQIQEGQSASGSLAMFTDMEGDTNPKDFTATIDWGDEFDPNGPILHSFNFGPPPADTSAGTIAGSGPSYTVWGSHQFKDEGSFTITVTIKDVDGDSAKVTSQVTVSDAQLTAKAGTFRAAPGKSVSPVIATFTDADKAASAGDFTATVDWGDGSSLDNGWVQGGNGKFTVTSTHTYSQAGTYHVKVTITDDGGSSATAEEDVKVRDTRIHITDTRTPTMTEGASGSVQLVDFTGPDQGYIYDDSYTATIDWGDGTTDTQPVQVGSESNAVLGTHTYAEEGTYTVGVTINDTTDDSGVSITTTVTVVDAPLNANGVDFTAFEGIPFTGVVATLTDADKFAEATDYTVTINWGDGTITMGSVSADPQIPNLFNVTGNEAYGTLGSYQVQIKIVDSNSSCSVIDQVVVETANPIITLVSTQYAMQGQAPDYVINSGVPVGALLELKVQSPDPAKLKIVDTSILWSGGTDYASYFSGEPGAIPPSSQFIEWGPKTNDYSYKFIVDAQQKAYEVKVNVKYQGSDVNKTSTVDFTSIRPQGLLAVVDKGSARFAKENMNVGFTHDQPMVIAASTTGIRFGGRFMILQLVNPSRYYKDNAGVEWVYQGLGGLMNVDNGLAPQAGVMPNPIGTGTDQGVAWALAFGQSLTATMSDPPSTGPVPITAKEVAVGKDSTEFFQTYLMYQPPGGVWVALSRQDWQWSADATNPDGTWPLGNITISTPQPGGAIEPQQGSAFPEWTGITSNISGWQEKLPP